MQESIQAATASPAIPATTSTSTNAGSAGNSASANVASGALASDFETFLKLLTSQLRNQDPLKPLDSTEFVAQLASFSAVEQQVNTNTKLDQLLGAMTRSGIDEAARLIDKNVDASGARIDIKRSGEIPIRYELPKGATEASLRIQDPTGRVVREIPLPLQNDELVWDGKNDIGLPVSPGSYTLNIHALKDVEDLTGGDVTISGTVEEAQIGNGEIILVLDNGVAITPADVRVIRTANSGTTNPGATNP